MSMCSSVCSVCRERWDRIVEHTQRNTARLVLARPTFPLFNARQIPALDQLVDIRDRLARRRVPDLDKRSRDESSTAQAPNRLGHEPLPVRLRDNRERLAGARVKLIRALGLEIVLDDGIKSLKAGQFGRWGALNRGCAEVVGLGVGEWRGDGSAYCCAGSGQA
ncbi:hypothetical protein FS749_004331 [Ceratobasidium sp. UAMH 11750]|nr:hypothetical protein FS749_004331 [Ceratobasidium sp. UAMH 11750]